MDEEELERRLAMLEAKLNQLLEKGADREEIELISEDDVPERLSFSIPENTIPRRVQLDLVLLGGSRPRREINFDLTLMGGSRPRDVSNE